MTRLGRQSGDPLVVDLSEQVIATWDDLWDALAAPCGLPTWFGRNLNAWWDTIDEGAIASRIDEHPTLIVRVSPTGIFGPGDADGPAFAEVTNRSEFAHLEVSEPRP